MFCETRNTEEDLCFLWDDNCFVIVYQNTMPQEQKNKKKAPPDNSTFKMHQSVHHNNSKL